MANDMAVLIAGTTAAINQMANTICERMIAGTPAGVVTSWPSKEEAAKRYLAGTPTADDTLMLTTEATRTGETLEVLVGKIIAAAAAYRVFVSDVEGIRRKALLAVESAASTDSKIGIVEAEMVAATEFRALMGDA